MAKVTAKKLAKDAGLNFEHVLYRRTGDWYHVLNKFPAALLDERGYLPFHTEADYKLFIASSVNRQVLENRDTQTLIIKNGISSVSKYTLFVESFTFPELVAEAGIMEGATIQITVNRYERDMRAKRICLEKWGSDCTVCSLSFGRVYGILGEGFIHMHHLTPIASIKKEYALVPERDLRPVCPNCHAMLHRKNPPHTIDELRLILGLPAAASE